jgi:hypothetical protein
MAENTEQRQPTHRIYSVIRGGTQGDCLIDIGEVSPRNDGTGFNALLHAMPEDGELTCREIIKCDPTKKPTPSVRPRRSNTKRSAQHSRR